VPALHATHEVELRLRWDLLASHFTHTAEPAELLNLPTSQDLQLNAPAAEYEPALQRLHSVDLPSANLPASHVLQLVAPETSWNLPEEQWWQVDAPLLP